MPHDNQGTKLGVGDMVLIPAEVTAIYMAEDFCNLTVKMHLPMYPSDRQDSLTLNAKQVVKGSVPVKR